MTTDNESRVPHIILLYWVIKIAATTLGETGADMFSMTFSFGYVATITIFMAAFLIFFGIKLARGKYEPSLYWLTFTATAIAGTAISDFIDRSLGLGYTTGSLILIVLLGVVLAAWYIKEGSLSVQNIHKASSESFYWVAFLIANTLGTAAGDTMADDLTLGFMLSTALISAALLLTAFLHYFTKISGIALFWIAFVLTRPFGATFGDFLTKTTDQGGLGLGTIAASASFAAVLVIALSVELRRRN